MMLIEVMKKYIKNQNQNLRSNNIAYGNGLFNTTIFESFSEDKDGLQMGHNFGDMNLKSKQEKYFSRPMGDKLIYHDDVNKNAPSNVQAYANSSKVNSTLPSIGSLDIITNDKGSYNGFPQLGKKWDLNKPEAFNETTGFGTIKNVFQITFHLNKGNVKEVGIARSMLRTYKAGSSPAIHTQGPDGPSLPTVIRPDSKTIVVADAPGYAGPKSSYLNKASPKEKKDIALNAFPIKYDGHFVVNVYDIIQPKILAQVKYRILIEKDFLNQSNPVNIISVYQKRIVK